jgi:hypothetical protein
MILADDGPGGGADEMFNGADTVAAARNEVPVSSSFGIMPPMATAVVVTAGTATRQQQRQLIPTLAFHRR